MTVSLAVILCGLAGGCGRAEPAAPAKPPVKAAAAAPTAPPALFGIALGAPVSAIPGARPFKPGWYAVPPPRPEPGLVQAAVEAFPDTGVCVIQGVGPVIAADPDGAKARAAIDALADRLSERYGEPAKLDDCSSLVCKPEFWAVDLQTGERHYGYRWSLHDGRPHGVWDIALVAEARSARDLVYLVEADGQNLTGCRDAETQASPDGP